MSGAANFGQCGDMRVCNGILVRGKKVIDENAKINANEMYSRGNVTVRDGSYVCSSIKDKTGWSLYNKIRDATVSIAVDGTSCSGWFIRPDGWVATAAHCVLSPSDGIVTDKIDPIKANVMVTGLNGVEGVNRIIQASNVYVDAAGDIAVLKLDGITDQPYLNWGNSSQECIGNRCFVVGNPLGSDTQSLSGGYVRDNNFVFYPQQVESMFVSAPTFGGNSGSPIINEECNVTGILTFGLIDSTVPAVLGVKTESLGGGMSSCMAQRVTDWMIENESDYTIKGWLGIDVWTVVNHINASELGLVGTDFNVQGIYLVGPGALDGSSPLIGTLMDGDVILEIDGVKIGDLEGQTHITKVTWFKQAGDQVEIKWMRPPSLTVNTNMFTLGTFPASNDSPLLGNLSKSADISPRLALIEGMIHKTKHNNLSLFNSMMKELVTNNTYTFRDPNAWPGDQQLVRLTPHAYGDANGDIPSGATRPNPRFISNTIFSQIGDSNPNPENLTDMFWLWGQFIDHDLGLSGENHGDSFNIPVPSGDVHFDPYNTGNVVMGFTRSGVANGTGVGGVPREQTSLITSFIDATNVYGTTASRIGWLRSYSGGKLKTSQGNMLPINDGTQDNAMPSKSMFVAGDVRSNEQTSLLSMHTLWMREHNWWCDKIKATYPSLTDEEIFQKARIMVESEKQAITFNEFLPLLVGAGNIPAYSGYVPGTDVRIANEFSAAAYRLGHTLVSDTLWRLDEDGQQIPLGHLSLRDAFFSPNKLANEGGIDPVLRGSANKVCQALDAKIVDSLRNFLFGQPGSGGLDLASLNIQRGRDHGFADLNTIRTSLGLTAYSTFSEITSDVSVQTALSTAYGGDINNIDLWVGGLCEDHQPGSMLGETFQYIVLDQFLRLRQGDELWYENRLTAPQIQYINTVKLSTVILRNTNIKSLRENVFKL